MKAKKLKKITRKIHGLSISTDVEIYFLTKDGMVQSEVYWLLEVIVTKDTLPMVMGVKIKDDNGKQYVFVQDDAREVLKIISKINDSILPVKEVGNDQRNTNSVGVFM